MKTATLLFLLMTIAAISSPAAMAARDGTQILQERQAARVTKADKRKAVRVLVYWDSRRTTSAVR